MSYASIPQQFASAQMALYNATEQKELLRKLTEYGYSAKRLQEGTALLNNAVLLYNDRNHRYEEKQEVSEQLKTQLRETHQRFKDHVATVKLAFRHDPITLSKFQVQRISTRSAEWQMQAEYFYIKAAMYANVLENYQLPQSELVQNQASVEALIAIRNRRMQKKGEAEEATRRRDQSVQALHAWMTEFRNVARLALKDSPQMLEALGIPVKSEKV